MLASLCGAYTTRFVLISIEQAVEHVLLLEVRGVCISGPGNKMNYLRDRITSVYMMLFLVAQCSNLIVAGS